MLAIAAEILVLAIILVGTDIAISAKDIKKRNGYIGPPKRARESDLLPVPYFHVVFTLPQELNQLALYQTKEVYDSLFQASWQTMETFGRKKGVQMGMISVLHTWGQNLSLHPHIHCIVPGGGVDGKGNWQSICSDGKFLFPVKALSKVFRAKYVGILSQKVELDKELRESLFGKGWIVYAKRPFGSPKSVVEYLGRYTTGTPSQGCHQQSPLKIH